MSVRTCIDRPLPRHLLEIARRKSCRGEGAWWCGSRRRSAKLWRNGRTLRVAFLDGIPEVQENVKLHAME